MRATSRLYRLKTTITSQLPVVAQEARALFRRRKVSYALLAVAVTAGSVYVGAAGYPMVTQHGTPASSGSEQPEPKGAPTTPSVQSSAGASGAGASDQASNDSSSGDVSSSSQTTVTVNGQQIEVPDNGHVHTSVSNDSSGSTSVDITHTSTGNDNSSLSVHVETSSGGGGAGGG